MRWMSIWGGAALLLAVTGGCQQQVFMSADDYNTTQISLISHLEPRPDLVCNPINKLVDAPPTLYNLDRKIRFLPLAEAVATALEQGTVGQPSLLFPGVGLDNLVQFTGNGVAGSDSIRVLSFDPANLGANIDQSLSKFDAFLSSSIVWNNTDQPIGTPLQTFQSGNQVNAIVQTDATAAVGVFKPLPTGGTAGITFNVPYTYTNLPARVNPSYRPQLVFGLDQPLLQGFGVEINQLRSVHPIVQSPLTLGALSPSLGSQFQPSGTPGILITRVRFDQQRAEFERNVNQMLLNVETAYWNLYGAYWTLYSREQGLRFAYEAYKLSKAGYEAGRVKAADFYQTRGQYELFRAQRLQAIDTVLDNERQLRALMGMPIEDGTRLMPCDSPTLAPYLPDWKTALHDALTRRPELFMAREDVKAAQMNLRLAKNSLLPDLRSFATYDFNAIGTRLDGAADNNAFRNLAQGNFSNWSIGLRLNVPFGYRLAHANLRQAEIQLARSLAVIVDQELKAERFLGLQYRRMSSAYEQIKAQRAQREAFGEQLRARNQEFLAGRGTLDILLEAQRFWADALANEYNAIVQYNNALCAFEFAKGTILQHDNAIIAEGPLPECAAERAVEHIRRRSNALILRERAAPPALTAVGFKPGDAPPPAGTGSLPDLIHQVPPLKDAAPLPASPDAPTPPPPPEAKMEELLEPPTPLDKAPESKPGPADKPTTLPPLPVSRPAAGRSPSDFGTTRDLP